MLFLRDKASYKFPWNDKLVWETPSLCWFHTFGGTISLVLAAWLPSGVAKMSGMFCNKGQKCKNGSNLPLGSLEVFVYGESSPKFTMYKKQRLMVLWQEIIKMLTTKVQKKISLGMTSWCEKRHLFAGSTPLEAPFLLYQQLDSPAESPKCRDVLRQEPKMQKRLKSPLRFFRSVCLWRIKPKIHNV